MKEISSSDGLVVAYVKPDCLFLSVLFVKFQQKFYYYFNYKFTTPWAWIVPRFTYTLQPRNEVRMLLGFLIQRTTRL